MTTEERLVAVEAALAQSRTDQSALLAEVSRLREQLLSAADEADIRDHQLAISQHKFELAQADVSTRSVSEQEARCDAHNEKLLRMAHESRLLPLHESLREREAELEEADARQSGRVLLAERLQTAEAQRVADAEALQAALLCAGAAEKKAANATERNGQLKAESAALRKRLAVAEEELALLRSSKELLAARIELQHELKRQRERVATEDTVVQRVVEETRNRQREITDGLVSTVGTYAMTAVAVVRRAANQADSCDEQRETVWKEKMQELEVSQLTEELSDGLEAARREIQAQLERISKLERHLRDEQEVHTKPGPFTQRAQPYIAVSALPSQALTMCQQKKSKAMVQSFHNTCLLVKLLLSTRQQPANVLVQARMV
jgi:hypothetical protein